MSEIFYMNESMRRVHSAIYISVLDEISCFIKGPHIYVFFEDIAESSALSIVLLDVPFKFGFVNKTSNVDLNYESYLFTVRAV